MSKFFIVVLAFPLFALIGCSGKNTITSSATQAVPLSPFVEAYLEYVGPPQRWAGPNSVIVHIFARDSDTAEIKVIPNFLRPNFLRPNYASALHENRIPASSSSGPLLGNKMTRVMAREELVRLASAMSGPEQPFFGCLNPIRARLVRADGSVLERHGCRDTAGWPVTLSQLVSRSIAATQVAQVQ
ncbi:MAG: hypothetical protein A2428_17270 [Bdellovibrionales bacterium RIFOXYC1_FULL_54_43]|nr:MAG: hypothetical protein A2428_17270 [Bdellovibrionales bacterium RIFOXYC1_FULL_54_43]OFZ84471.1 MAG: hypothetical protein A2603_03115 [Bdellovibrionales bacterium RIFOXYD1_FULL_55_31]